MRLCLRFLPVTRVRYTRSFQSPLVRCFCVGLESGRSDTVDLSVDDIPLSTRPSSVVNVKLDPKPTPYKEPPSESDRQFALEHWKFDDEKIEDGEMAPPSDDESADSSSPSLPSSSSSPAPSSFSASSPSLDTLFSSASSSSTSTNNNNNRTNNSNINSSSNSSNKNTDNTAASSTKPKPYQNVHREYEDRLRAEIKQDNKTLQEHLIVRDLELQQQKERRAAIKLKRQSDQQVREDERREKMKQGILIENEDNDIDIEEEREINEEAAEEEERKEREELQYLGDVMSGRKELKNDWYSPLAASTRPNTELCTNIDQFVGFFNEIVMSLQEVFSADLEEMDKEDKRERLTEVQEYLTNFDEGFRTLESAILYESEEHKNYFVTSLGGKDQASAKLRNLVMKSMVDMEKPSFGPVAQVKILRELNTYLPPSKEADLDFEDLQHFRT